MKTIEFLTAACQAVLKQGYSNIALRSLQGDEAYKVGDECRQSYEWDIEQDCSTYETTGELAGGTCGIGINVIDEDDVDEIRTEIEKALKALKIYGKGQGALIAGDENVASSYSLDPGEARITNAKVYALFEV